MILSTHEDKDHSIRGSDLKYGNLNVGRYYGVENLPM